MSNSNCFSCDTQDYLKTYNCILDNMIKEMNCACQNNSISNNFINQMIPHHEAAIAMCENVLQYTDNHTLRCICKNIIEQQKKSICCMREIQGGCDRYCSSGRCLASYRNSTQRIMNNMFISMRNATQTNCINCNFLRQMIPHHEGAVCMCENLLKYDICPGLTTIARDIIADQQRGICEMKELMCELDCCK
ncbi:MAG: DUF305 domain-containing protein [Eubacterium sp.]|nr:DUF305 domain-containing protein [Eubacterium sp.]